MQASGDKDVYVFADARGTLSCCDCQLGNQGHFDSTRAMVNHLADHRAAGHNVPDIEAELWAHDAENFPG